MRGRPERPPGDGEPAGRCPADAELVAAAQCERRAFAPLYERYQDDLLRYCFFCLENWDDAADATQQVFTNALANLRAFRDRGDSFRGWLFTIARHEVGIRQRRGARQPDAPLAEHEELADPAPTPEERAVATDDLVRLRALLAALPPKPRQVCELRLADLTDREIAGVLEMTEGAVRTAQSRAVEHLRRLLGAAAVRTGGRDG